MKNEASIIDSSFILKYVSLLEKNLKHYFMEFLMVVNKITPTQIGEHIENCTVVVFQLFTFNGKT
jgi:hypothetical protein